jgi:hypothetical protein
MRMPYLPLRTGSIDRLGRLSMSTRTLVNRGRPIEWVVAGGPAYVSKRPAFRQRFVQWRRQVPLSGCFRHRARFQYFFWSYFPNPNPHLAPTIGNRSRRDEVRFTRVGSRNDRFDGGTAVIYS